MDDRSSPPPGTFTQVSAGGWHTCGIKTDGTLVCWGYDEAGDTTPPSGTFTQLSAGGWHTCGIETNGTLVCWGYNQNNQASPPPGTFIQLSAGGYHTCAIKSDDTLACWGAGTTNTGVWPEYGQSIAPSGSFTQVSAGQYHTCGLKKDGSLVCWGYNASGQSNPFSLSGSVGAAGAILSYTDGNSKTVTADGSGNYTFAISYDWSGTVTPFKIGYTFLPIQRTYTNVLGNQAGQDYTNKPANPYLIYLPLGIR